MKKQIVNNKVLRGVAIAMSVMMAITSVPVGAFAAGEEGQTTEETVSIEDGIEACGVIDDITSPDEDNDNVIPVTEVVEEAREATEQIKDEEISENLSNVLSEDENDRVEIINEAVSEYKDNLNEIKGKGADADNAADRLAETVSSTEKTVPIFSRYPIISRAWLHSPLTAFGPARKLPPFRVSSMWEDTESPSS